MGPELSSPESERPVGRGQRTQTYVREAQQRVEEGRPPVQSGRNAARSWLSRWGAFAAILLVCLAVLMALRGGLLG